MELKICHKHLLIMIFQADFMYKITNDVTNKTMYIVNKGFALLGRGL